MLIKTKYQNNEATGGGKNNLIFSLKGASRSVPEKEG